MSAFLKAVFDWTMQNTIDYSAEPPEVDEEKVAWLRDAWEHLVTDGATLLRNGLRMAQDPATTERNRAMVLENLADLVENIDNANVLEPLGGWPVVLSYARCYRQFEGAPDWAGEEEGEEGGEGEEGAESAERGEGKPEGAEKKETGDQQGDPTAGEAKDAQADALSTRSPRVVYWSLMIIANVVHSNDKGLRAGMDAGLWEFLNDFLGHCRERARPETEAGAPGPLLPLTLAKGFVAVFSGVLQSHDHSADFVASTSCRTAEGVLEVIEGYIRGYGIRIPRFDHLREQLRLQAEAGAGEGAEEGAAQDA